MLLPNQIVKMKWHPRNKDYYVSLGYNFTKMGEEFDVKIEHLTKGAKPKVKMKCDYCGKLIEIKYQNYINRCSPQLKDACNDCKAKKITESVMTAYGVTNVFQLEETKEKAKETIFEKYGNEHYSQTEEYKEKCEQTCMEKYGKPHYAQTSEFWNKCVSTNIKTRGVPYATQSLDVIEKIKRVQEKRYGGMGFGSPIVKEKIKRACKEKYGTKTPMKNFFVREKVLATLCKNGNAKTSRPQLNIYNMLKPLYSFCELNYPCGRCALDCAIKVEDTFIDVEYDGVYWHQDATKDRRRDYFVKSQGYKVLRIKGTNKIPKKEELLEAIDYLVKGSHSYMQINLDV